MTVNCPSGNITLMSVSSNRRSSSAIEAVSTTVIESSSPLAVPVCSLPCPLVVAAFTGAGALSFRSSTSFHLKVPCSIPSPSTISSDAESLPLFRVETCSSTSSSSKYVEIRLIATPALRCYISNMIVNSGEHLTCKICTMNAGMTLRGAL